MTRTWLGALLAIVVAGALVWVGLYFAAGEYRLTNCFMPDEDVTRLMFRNGLDSHREVSFSNKGQFSTFRTSWGKAAIDWTDIASVHTRRYPRDPRVLYLSVEFKNGETFEAGLIDRACYLRVRERYGKSLRFIDQ